jgi:proteic killer suppression protein
MIKSFKHKGLEEYFVQNSTKKINAQQAPRIRRILDRLDASSEPKDMNLPGYGLHELTGNRKGTWSVTVSGNWRITFKFSSEHAHDVNLEDYH